MDGNVGNAKAEKQGQVSEQLTLLGSTISDLKSVIEGLDNKLSNISTSSPLETATKDGKEPVVLCELADKIRMENDFLRNCFDHLRDIKDRLEN